MSAESVIRLPHNWTPRDYQKPFWSFLEHGGKRALAIWHRRSGKDEVLLHRMACATQERVGTYWYMLPEASQARKAIWEAINPHTGKRRIDDAFPHGLRATTREQDMMIRFKNGSTFQVVGSDNFNSLVGAPPIGIVFSEWALANPSAWAYLRPILLENGGWAAFNTTPRGRNHAWRMFRAHEGDEDWFTEVLSADRSGVFSPEALHTEAAEYRAEYGEAEGKARFDQEYLCSFEAGVPGAYYADFIRRAEEEGRITRVPWDPQIEVVTAWDLGYSDSTAIWFAQVTGREIRLIDYYENAGQGLDHYVKAIRERPYLYHSHILPHDVEVHELGTGKSRLETLQALGLGAAIKVCPNLPLDDGIQAARAILPRIVFDTKRTEKGLDALRLYHRDWDPVARAFKQKPRHDWTSHAADAFRYLAIGLDERAGRSHRQTELSYDERNRRDLDSLDGTVLIKG